MTAGQSRVTFNRDIAPIVWQHCGECHRPGEIGPFSLLNYGDVRSHGRKIVEVTQSGKMPPWLPEPGYGEFSNERRLADADIQRLKQWVDEGAIQGDPTDLPPQPSWPEGWRLGQPDLVVTLPEPYLLQPGTNDVFRNFVLPIPIDSARWVRGIEVRPGNNHVVHHATIGFDRTRASRRLDAEDPEPGFSGGMFSESTSSADNHALGWTPGMTPVLEGPDMAWRLDKGSDLVLQLHLLPPHAEPAEAVRPSIGFFFTDTAPTRRSIDFKLGSETIDIPAGEANYAIEDRYRLPVDVDLVSIYPHAHYLGKEMKAFATLPDGSAVGLLWIKHWDFHWQDQYRYATPVPLPRGTEITMHYTYDNSDGNPNNPHHPPVDVAYGPQSSDEMGDLWLRLVPHSADDMATLAQSYVANEQRKDLDAARQMVAEHPDDAKWHTALGAFEVQAGRVAEGMAEFDRALRLDPSDADAHNNLGHALILQGRLPDALAQLRVAARLAPDNDVILLNLANALQDTGQDDEAIREYRRVLALNPDSADAHNDLGTALAAKGLLEEAADHFAQALTIRPDHPDARKNLEQARQLLGR